MNRLKEKGLTLVELLIVTTIIVFLVFLGLIYYRSQIFKGTDAKRKGDIHKIQVAMEEYEKDHNCYPKLELLKCNPGNGLQPYLEKIPCEPESGESYVIDYDNESCASWYRIFVNLDNTKDADITKVGCLYGCGPTTTNINYNYYASSPNAPAPYQANSEGLLEVSPQGDIFYGCRGGTCVRILWDPAKPGPVCEPNYQNANCYGQCSLPNSECVDWK